MFEIVTSRATTTEKTLEKTVARSRTDHFPAGVTVFNSALLFCHVAETGFANLAKLIFTFTPQKGTFHFPPVSLNCDMVLNYELDIHLHNSARML